MPMLRELTRRPSQQQVQGAAASDTDLYASFAEEICHHYVKVVHPLEEKYKFETFGNRPLNKGLIHSKPIILIVGPHGAGKTTLIRRLLGRDLPPMYKETYAKKFTVIMHGETDAYISGNVLSANEKLPFTSCGLPYSEWEKIEGLALNSDVLKSIILIDTPGIGLGISMEYREFLENTILCFAALSERVVIVFDSKSAEISDEINPLMSKMSIGTNPQKFRIVINKYKSLDAEDFLKFQAKFMWHLQKLKRNISRDTEVFLCEFEENDQKQNDEGDLVDLITKKFLKELKLSMSDALLTKVNYVVQRAYDVNTHVYIVTELAASENNEDQIRNNIREMFKSIAEKCNICKNELPWTEYYLPKIGSRDFKKFASLDEKLMQTVSDFITTGSVTLITRIKQAYDPAQKEKQQRNPVGTAQSEAAGADQAAVNDEEAVYKDTVCQQGADDAGSVISASSTSLQPRLGNLVRTCRAFFSPPKKSVTNQSSSGEDEEEASETQHSSSG